MDKRMFSEAKAKRILLHILIPILIAVLSIFVLSNVVSRSNFIQSTTQSVENGETMVLEFAAATTATSLALSALPGDFGSSLSDTFASMSKYVLIILIATFLEKIILLIGPRAAFTFLIPIVCGLYIAGYYTHKDIYKVLWKKILIMGIALVFVVPCSVKLSNYVGNQYIEDVNQTIAQANDSADQINGEASSGNESGILDRLAKTFKTVASGVSGFVQYFKDMIKKCVTSIVVLIVINFVMPIITLFIFKWLIEQLFQITIPTSNAAKQATTRNDVNATNIRQ